MDVNRRQFPEATIINQDANEVFRVATNANKEAKSRAKKTMDPSSSLPNFLTQLQKIPGQQDPPPLPKSRYDVFIAGFPWYLLDSLTACQD